MNLPNKLTVLRACLVPVFMVVLLLEVIPLKIACLVGAVVFALTSLTDMLDGKIARKHNLVTDFGKFMDPLADKVMVICSLLAIMVRLDYLADGLVWVTAIVVFRELAVTSLRLVAAGKAGKVIAAAFLGKLKTVTQIVCILCMLLEPVIFPESWTIFSQYHGLSYGTRAAMTVMTLWSGLDYMRKYWAFLDPKK